MAWTKAGKRQKNGQRQIALATLQKLMDDVPVDQRIPRIQDSHHPCWSGKLPVHARVTRAGANELIGTAAQQPEHSPCGAAVSETPDCRFPKYRNGGFHFPDRRYPSAGTLCIMISKVSESWFPFYWTSDFRALEYSLNTGKNWRIPWAYFGVHGRVEHLKFQSFM